MNDLTNINQNSIKYYLILEFRFIVILKPKIPLDSRFCNIFYNH